MQIFERRFPAQDIRCEGVVGRTADDLESRQVSPKFFNCNMHIHMSLRQS